MSLFVACLLVCLSMFIGHLSPAKINRCMQNETILERLSAMHWHNLKKVIVEVCGCVDTS